MERLKASTSCGPSYRDLLSLKLTASLPLKMGLNAPKGNNVVFQASIFRCERLVSGRESVELFHPSYPFIRPFIEVISPHLQLVTLGAPCIMCWHEKRDAYPIPIGSMGRLYVLTFSIKINHSCRVNISDTLPETNNKST